MTSDGCGFDRRHYEVVLGLIGDEYDALRFREWRPSGGPRPRLFLRHDVDHSLALALEMAEMEAAAAVRSTYFVQLHSELYSPASARGTKLLRRIVSLGHEVGLHYDTGFYQEIGAETRTALATDLETLAGLTGVSVESVSRHLPTVTPELDETAGLAVFDAYSERFVSEVKYISDSNMSWREGCVCEFLPRRVELQVLVHPVWWLAGGETMSDRLHHCASSEADEYLAEAHRTERFYQNCLRQREVLDAG